RPPAAFSSRQSSDRLSSMKIARESSKTAKEGYLDGQVLIAMPAIEDERFSSSVIYLCAHSSEGAMGIIVNQPANDIHFSDLLVQLDVIPGEGLIELPQNRESVRVLK